MARKGECSFGPKADAEMAAKERELRAHIEDVSAQWTGHIEERLKRGTHPEEVRRRTLRALPVAKLSGLAVWFVYVEAPGGISVLHVTLARGATNAVPPLPQAAWGVAQERLDSGIW